MKTVDLKLEVVAIPVADVDRAKRFYGETLGWRLDGDFTVGDEFRGLQFTPPGSPSSIHFGKGVTPAAPGSAKGLFLVSPDIVAARAEARRPRRRSERNISPPGSGQAAGQRPESGAAQLFLVRNLRRSRRQHLVLQEVTTRLPGRVEADETKYASLTDLASAMRRAEIAHGEHEKKLGQRDADWPSWYASYMIAEQSGKPLPT